MISANELRIKTQKMSYYDQIDPIGEELNECINCGAQTLDTYCSRECKEEHNE